MEAARRWIQTLALAALAIAALSLTLRPEGDAHAARPASALCQAFTAPDDYGDLSVLDATRTWMNEQITQGRDRFVATSRGADGRAMTMCAW